MANGGEGLVRKIGVAGAGTMGAGIALVGLLAGLDVTLYDIADEMLVQGREYLQKHLARKGSEAALARLTCSTDLEVLAGAEVIVEAVVEKLPVKQELFGRLDRLCPPPAILATNTSTLAVTAIAAAVDSPERVAGMHFFNPAPVLPLVEVARAARTADETIRALVRLAEQMGKTPVVTRDTPGFIVNRVARPFYGEALRLLGEGAATHAQIDQVVRSGGGFRMGPFQLMDLIGLDVNFAATRSMYEQTFHEPRYRPHPIQEQMVQQKALGRKTGRGFYRYDDETPAVEMPDPPPDIGRHNGVVLVSAGSWAPGLFDLLRQAGYRLAESYSAAPPVAGLVPAGCDEDLAVQVGKLDRALPPDVPLFCQAADITVGQMAAWLDYPERLIGFDGLFAGAGQAVTMVASPILSEGLRRAADHFWHGLGRQTVWITDSPGLILPRLVGMLANEAAFAAGEGVADPETINRAMILGVNYPQGPLAWARELGYRRVVAVLDHLLAEYGEERYRTAPWLRRLARFEHLS